MNFKEAFRYQKHLDNLFKNALIYIDDSSYSHKKIATHHIHEVNPEADDKVEEILADVDFEFNHALLLIEDIITEREAICIAIDKVKVESEFDMDAMSEANKFRRQAYSHMKRLLAPPRKPMETTGTSFKFDANGVQAPYRYRIEYEYKDNYDRGTVRKVTKQLIEDADRISQEIDTYMTNTQIDFTPKFSVNESFNDIMESLKETGYAFT